MWNEMVLSLTKNNADSFLFKIRDKSALSINKTKSIVTSGGSRKAAVYVCVWFLKGGIINSYK